MRSAPCGRWFDAVVVDAFDAVLAIGRIQHRSGPVIEDQVEDAVSWLVPIDTADAWGLRGIRILGGRRSGSRRRAGAERSSGWSNHPPWATASPARNCCAAR
ncbi:hypothetical protein [Streptomyces sp. B6B3]|uniref:hypothetical protein n=1 Tax=Streptomyces sp. B6B3 TaxID=3153570 RepID=UPI00325E8578